MGSHQERAGTVELGRNDSAQQLSLLGQAVENLVDMVLLAPLLELVNDGGGLVDVEAARERG